LSEPPTGPPGSGSRARGRLTRPAPLVLFLGCLDEVASESPCHSTTGAPSDAIGYDAVPVPEGLWRESEAFLRPLRVARSLKTQQRAFTSRPPRPSGRGGINLVMP